MRLIYRLDDVVARNAKWPSFEIPSRSVRESCQPGDLVKLVFVPFDQSLPPERMWVKISSVTSVGYVGTLESTPLSPGLATRGDEVFFRENHICGFEPGRKPS